MKADLHVHSKFSKKPTEWFLKRIGAHESYTEPEFIYRSMKNRGMDLVTITDHNVISGCLKLKEKYPEDTFISVESTAHFPEDDCKIHVLIYDINEEQFSEIQKLRYNVYELASYLNSNSIVSSVAHPVYSINNILTLNHLEKLLLIFDNFEITNGCRGEMYNEIIKKLLIKLDHKLFEEIQNRQNITPLSEKIRKGVTGGSDDHSGLLAGTVYTESKIVGGTKYFLESIRECNTQVIGKSADFYTLAFNIYKIAYDFSHQNRNFSIAEGIVGKVAEFLSSQKKLSFYEKFKLRKIKKKSKIHNLLVDLIKNLSEMTEKEILKKLDLVYEKVSEISDEFIKKNLNKFAKKDKINIDKIYHSVTSIIPGIFLTVPFISSYRHVYKDFSLVKDIKKAYFPEELTSPKRIAWFTDTIDDLNGVSVTIKNIGRESLKNNYPLKIFSSLNPDNITNEIPKNFSNIPPLVEFPLPYYNKLSLKIPSILKALKSVYQFKPDEIYISTPGPVGIVGLIIGKIMNLKVTGVYHTDFTKEIYSISKDLSLASIVESSVNLFYNQMDFILATSSEYLKLLSERGIKKEKLSIFKRGIDTEKFTRINDVTQKKRGITLIYSGRISKDKNLEFLLDVYGVLKERYKKESVKIELYVVGDGPHLKLLTKKVKDKDVIFSGRVNNEEVVSYLSKSDIFLFPSNTDTFGMAVLEAQACGVPAVVSDLGGPKDIVLNGLTGFVAKADNIYDWETKVSYLIDCRLNSIEKFSLFQEESVKNARINYDWKVALDKIFNPNGGTI